MRALDVFMFLVIGVISLGVAVFLVDCGYRAFFADPESYVVIAKDRETQGHLWGFSGGKSGYMHGSQSEEYYLVAENGLVCVVGKGEWHRVREGDSYSSVWWRKR